MAKKTAITPTRSEDYAQWYQQVVRAAELAQSSSVRGCMVMRPWGYGIWENIQQQLDAQLKATGHDNIYCPLLIPLSHLEKEAEHVDGFAKECAVVTHHRLQKTDDGSLEPVGKLEEPFVIRPTSETLIGEIFAGWVQSYRDLPLKVNQWANVMRWEMRTRLFLRTSEFLWQEGHTAHSTAEQAHEESRMILDLYHDFVRDYLAIPTIKGEKSESERFPGAVNTYTIEALMQDNKALQAGTSHFLGQNFARAFNIQYLSADGQQELVWTSSWGVSTRLVGALIMTHSDDDGLILPPKIAPQHIVILPIIHDDKDREKILNYCDNISRELSQQHFNGQNIKVKIDDREMRGGEKSWHWIKKGIPVRLEIGPKECEAGLISLTRRDAGHRDRKTVSLNELSQNIEQLLTDIQQTIYDRALTNQQNNTHEITNKQDFYDFFKDQNGFVSTYWNGDPQIEQQIQQELSVTIRCLPLADQSTGQCIFSNDTQAKRVVFARSY